MQDEYILKKRIDRQHARGVARKLLKECGMVQAPVRLGAIVKKLDLYVDKGLTEFLEEKKISAFIDLEDGIIEYNDKHPVVRKRFSVAHEIGHKLMGHSVRADIFNINSNDPREVEANVFAAELLMPYDWLKADLKSGLKVKDLAWKYWVSEEAMGWRLFKSDALLLK